MFSKELNAKLDEFHLLKHPFYQAWNEGKLSREIIKDYAEQYYHHVKAFPRYISATHSICENIADRKILLENLNDEEDKNNDHPKLWKQFAVALGADENEIEKVKLEKFTSEMIDNFFKQGRSTYAEGLSGLAFFETHKKADVYHRQECEVLLDNLSKDDQAKAEKAALSTAKYLWNFLSGVAQKHNLNVQAAA
ncbi:MAG: pyrroloquinoline quinone biosynthesis protein PqqC [Candidatus Fonsibacter ubiquis]|nr:pyrroloquinoline quinone biosynthesis protein PqqC [Candidatus Fonsibacter ubiquis]